MGSGTRGYRDLQEHLDALAEAGLLHRIGEAIDKDAEMHPLVRWQFRGGIAEADRKAFLFTDITDGKGRKYDIPVAVGGLAASEAVYSIGMGVPVEDIAAKWDRAISAPVAPQEIDNAPCHEVVLTGADLTGEGNGWEGDFYKTSAKMGPGVSGGAAFTELGGDFIGIPTGGSSKEESEGGDILGLIRPSYYAVPLIEKAATFSDR